MSFHRSSVSRMPGEVPPLNTGTRLDMEHRKFGPGYQRDLQARARRRFAGLTGEACAMNIRNIPVKYDSSRGCVPELGAGPAPSSCHFWQFRACSLSC